jgi:hypothetical protein
MEIPSRKAWDLDWTTVPYLPVLPEVNCSPRELDIVFTTYFRTTACRWKLRFTFRPACSKAKVRLRVGDSDSDRRKLGRVRSGTEPLHVTYRVEKGAVQAPTSEDRQFAFCVHARCRAHVWKVKTRSPDPCRLFWIKHVTAR